METLHHLGEHIDVRNWRRLVHSGQVVMLLLLVAAIGVVRESTTVNAADLTSRSVRITTSQPSVSSGYNFQFSFNSINVVGSLSFEYCSNSPIPTVACVAPAGFDSSFANLVSQTGEVGFSVHANTNANRVVLTRAASAVTPGAATYQLDNIINPSSVGTAYVRVAAHVSTDGTGVFSDTGSVAFATARSLAVNAYVPPYLTLCVAITVAGDCSTASGDVINLGNLSNATANTGTTQFAAATNDFLGYSVFIAGNTMTAGSSVIPPLNLPAGSAAGTAQFGLNLRDNTAPNVGQNPTGAGTAAPQGDYAIPDNFKFAPGDLVAQSTTSTDFNVFTVSYLVNVPVGQSPGVYSTTISYIATAAF